VIGPRHADAHTPADLSWNRSLRSVRWRHAEWDLLRRWPFGLIRGEVQQSGTVTPGQERYESGLRDRSANFERPWKLFLIAALAGHRVENRTIPERINFCPPSTPITALKALTNVLQSRRIYQSYERRSTGTSWYPGPAFLALRSSYLRLRMRRPRIVPPAAMLFQ
jgi:hypothetical protein